MRMRVWRIASAGAVAGATLALLDFAFGPGAPAAPQGRAPAAVTLTAALEGAPTQPLGRLPLTAALDDAALHADGPQLRRLIAEHRREYPHQSKTRAGYERIADCLETPGPHSRKAAGSYCEREPASTLCRSVQRACFEGPASSR